MFTGLVEHTALVEGVEAPADDEYRVVVQSPWLVESIELGESIALNGVCLTVSEFREDLLVFDVSSETLTKTTLEELAAGDGVHLERSLNWGDALGGHLVLGHVDGVGVVNDRTELEKGTAFEFVAPSSIVEYLMPQGCIAIDGVSLTISDIENDRFTVVVIPHTGEVTTLLELDPGDRVNVEADILGKYIQSLDVELGQLSPDEIHDALRDELSRKMSGENTDE